MPETIGNETPVSQTTRKRNERTEAKFFEDVEKIIAEAERLGAEYNPPNTMAALEKLKGKRDETVAARSTNQANEAAEEQSRNTRENLFKSLNSDISSLVDYAVSAGKAENEIAALKTIAREIKGRRARTIDPNDGENHISVANLSYVTRADNYARFIEQYETLQIPTTEDKYKTATHRTKQTALTTASNAVIASEAASNTTGEALDKLAFTDADSLMNACISAKKYIRSKYGAKGQPYLNIAKTRLELPTRLRKKK